MDMITLAMAKAYTDSHYIGSEHYETIKLDKNNRNPSFNGSLIGAKVVDYSSGRRKAREELDKPNVEGNATIAVSNANDMYIAYDTAKGVLNKPCLIISGDAVRIVFPYMSGGNIYEGYDAILYAYETVTDTYGMGLSMAKGWYVVNTTTFAFVPINIIETPVYIPDEMRVINQSYFEYAFPLCETITYTVAEENFIENDEYQGCTPYKGIRTSGSYSDLRFLSTITYFVAGSYLELCSEEATITYVAGTKTIDPKYLPGVCLPVLNGVLNFDNYDEATTPMLELSEELKEEVNTAPDGFLARCKRTDADGNVLYATVMFLPAGVEGIMTGYNASFSFPADPVMMSVVIMSMGGEMICQVTKH